MEMNDDILDRLKAGRFFLPAFLLVLVEYFIKK